MKIPYGRQAISEADIDAVTAVLRSEFLTQGPAIERFEEAVATRVGVRHAIAVSNGTAALHLACLGMGLGRGDLLWTVPNTFVASANCALYCGAEVDFVDIDPDTWNLSTSVLREKLEWARSRNHLPSVLVPVHFGGQPTEQDEIFELSQEFGFRVLEDASHSIGAERMGEPVGSCRWSDATVFSFHPVKIITSGEGGMILTNDDELAYRVSILRTHGITRNADSFMMEPKGPWYHEQQTLGFNYRMTDIQAALGCSQLDRIDEFVSRRNLLAKRYDLALADLPLSLPQVRRENRSSFHLYVVRLGGPPIPERHRTVFSALQDRGLGVNVHYMPVHLQPHYRRLGFEVGQFPEAEAYGDQAITLPLFPSMTDAEQDYVVACLREVL